MLLICFFNYGFIVAVNTWMKPNLSSFVNLKVPDHFFSSGVELPNLAQLQNAWLTTHLIPGVVTGSSLLSGEPKSPAALAKFMGNPGDPYSIERAAKLHRSAAGMCNHIAWYSSRAALREPPSGSGVCFNYSYI